VTLKLPLGSQKNCYTLKHIWSVFLDLDFVILNVFIDLTLAEDNLFLSVVQLMLFQIGQLVQIIHSVQQQKVKMHISSGIF